MLGPNQVTLLEHLPDELIGCQHQIQLKQTKVVEGLYNALRPSYHNH